jgi:N-acetylglucosamine-6-phosphate deacetylase
LIDGVEGNLLRSAARFRSPAGLAFDPRRGACTGRRETAVDDGPAFDPRPGGGYHAAMPESLRITGCRILTPFVDIPLGDIVLEGEHLVSVGPEGREADHTLEAGGRLAIPGLIDVHLQGAGGCDVLDGKQESLDVMARTCSRHGVTGFLATTVFRPGGDNRHLPVAAGACRPERRALDGADLLGIHLEGPFIAPERRGMIRPDCLGPVRQETLTELLRLCGGTLRMMTIAPELPGALEMIRSLTSQGVVASFGHSAADYVQACAGLKAGIRHATHLFNAMPPLHHREPGPVPALLERREVTLQVIADGVHLHPAILRLLASSVAPERIVLITDGLQALGLEDGRYTYNRQPILVSGGTARSLDGTLVGTALGMNRLVQRYQGLTGCPLAAAVRAASFNPACVLGIQKRTGSLESGKSADLALLNPDFTVWKTWKRGRLVFKQPAA